MKKYIEIEKQTREELREVFEDMLEAATRSVLREDLQHLLEAKVRGEDVQFFLYPGEDGLHVYILDPDDRVQSTEDIEPYLDDLDYGHDNQFAEVAATMARRYRQHMDVF